MIDVPGTFASLLDAVTAVLRDAGVSEPRREAHALARAVVQPGALADPSVLAPLPEVQALLRAADRRAAGEPAAYATGSTGFRHLTLRCDARALIPRPETEGLVEAALARVAHGVAVDVGTGTGAIALSLRMEGRFDEVIGIDLSSAALALASENGASSGLSVTWLEGDLLEPLGGRMVDLLVSNPPYLSQGEHDALDPSVRDYEPALALVSGDDGLEATRRLLCDGRAVVRHGGWMVLEIDTRRADASAALARSHGWAAVEVQDDLFGRARYLLARQGDDS